MNSQPPNDAATQHEERLALVVSDLTDAAQRGEAVTLEEACQQHPDLADDLRELWGVIMVADAAGDTALSQTDTQAAPPPEPFKIPKSFGDYELGQELGRGGMGVVYRARQVSLDREVALKLMIRGELASDADRLRFQAEAEAAARLHHPNIVPVYEVGEFHGRPYFSMKYVEGDTLAKLLEDGPLPPRLAARLIADLAAAIDYAHSRGVMHRDIKPSNVLLDKEGQPHLTDFGLAKRDNDTSLTRTGAVLGTPAFMSPEQASGGRIPIGPRSDIYSLGCILYQMLAGRPSVDAQTPVDAVMQVLEQDPPSPRESNPLASRDLELIALRCMQKPAELRYPTAGELAADLQAYLKDESISARSGRFSQIVARLFRETHHAPLLENWGLLWMWHSAVLLIVCIATNAMLWAGVTDRWSYAGLWVLTLWAWAAVFWTLRQRIGPVTFVERQIAHVWAAAMICTAALFPLEWRLDLEPLTLSPVLGLVSMMVFLIKSAILTGRFYVQAGALGLTSIAMAVWPDYGHLIFGAVSAVCFFLPGLKYHLQRRRRLA